MEGVLQATLAAAFIGGSAKVLHNMMENTQRKIRSVKLRTIQEHENVELWDAFAELTALIPTQGEHKKALDDMTHKLTRLLTLHESLQDVSFPPSQFWTARAVQYKFAIDRALKYIKARYASPEFEQMETVIKKAADDAAHNIQVKNFGCHPKSTEPQTKKS